MNFKTIATTTAFAFAPFIATASNISAPVQTPTIAPLPPTATTMDWSGAYVGLGYGIASGDYEFRAATRDMADGDIVQLYGGYQIQRGALVYGGELAFGDPNDTNVTRIGFPVFYTANVIDLIDLKGRVGYASGDYLFYGVLGYSMAEYADDVKAPIGWDVDGVNYGIGVDYAITDNFLIGAEYLMRDLTGDNPAGTNTVTIDLDTLSIRATYKF
jgi:outer membrane immunogenic protein